MKVLLIAAGLLAVLAILVVCTHLRKGGELRLRHEVTVATPEGNRTSTSVVSMDSFQNYNYGPGGGGWGSIICRLTGSAVCAPVGHEDFYFLLADQGTTPSWTQIRMVKKHFRLPNLTTDDSWVEQWRSLARSNAAIDIAPEDYPRIAVMPRAGWMDDARLLTLEEAEQRGLRVIRYRLQITQDPVGADPAFEVRYRSAGKQEVWPENFTVVNARV